MNGLKFREAERILKRNGFHEIRTKGSHHRFTNGKKFISVPYDVNGALWNGIVKRNNLK